MRLLILVSFLFCIENASSQKIESPEEFLGYQLGEKFTTHAKVVSYFEKTALAAKDRVKLEYYGQTYEGRDLLLAFVSSRENMLRLEEIRLNNLRMAGVLQDKKPDLNLPAVVWLSYNVHGNEASSTEVAIKLLFESLSGTNRSLNDWLKNVVVVIDPCLNPDGRDRYVNWLNQTMGKSPNPNPLAREHSEPWPGGRTNHYNFDMNRDWAWQTQIESQQRMEKYNEWMPQIHCDFHEQYPENPYYFAPAAEPMHEVITPWQRSFQTTIGKNHADYFDANGWLYFTKEVFDLFYPSYGDTYPMYNGSIGMTYEQAGHSRGGVAIQVQDDTLTLSDRIAHHYTTSISTIEIAFKHQKEIQEQYQNYFQSNIKNGNGEYASFIVSSTDNTEKVNQLLKLLDKNRIVYQWAKSNKSLKGYNYSSQKTESFNLNAGDLVISTCQPKGALVKVLFEPNSKLTDSVTYDITAWALPYVYGLNAHAVHEKITTDISSIKPSASITLPSKQAYGYLIPYHSFSGSVLLADLLNKGIKVRFSEKDMKIKGQFFKKGTFIILQNENKGKIDLLFEAVTKKQKETAIAMFGIESGFVDAGLDFGSDKVHVIKPVSVGLVTGTSTYAGAAGEIWHLFEQELNYPITLINSDELASVDLRKIDVLIMPEGDYTFLRDKESFLKNWVKQGGRLIALESVVSQMADGEWGIKLKKENDPSDKNESVYKDIKRYEDRERNSVTNGVPGAIYHVLLDDSHPLAMGYENDYSILKQNTHVLEFLKGGWNVGTIKQKDLLSGFVGSNVADKIKDGTVLGVQGMGDGSVIYFTDNPVFRSFWQNGKQLIANAVFLVGK